MTNEMVIDRKRTQQPWLKDLFFSFKRLNRSTYLICTVSLTILWTVLMAWNKIESHGAAAYANSSFFNMLGCDIVAIIIQGFFSVKRLRDLNLSAWHLLIFIIPLVSIVFEIYIMVKKGTSESNKYGDPQTDLSKKQLFILICPAILVLAFIGAGFFL